MPGRWAWESAIASSRTGGRWRPSRNNERTFAVRLTKLSRTKLSPTKLRPTKLRPTNRAVVLLPALLPLGLGV